MPYTVRHLRGFNDRREFDVYVRLLQQRGIDWSNAPRTPEFGTDKRWLYVWGESSEAEKFCENIKNETRDDDWEVHRLQDAEPPTRGSLVRVEIRMRKQNPTAEFSLHPHSQMLIRRRFPDAKPVSSISVEWSSRRDFDLEHGSMWDPIATVLTGLKLEELDLLEGYQIYDLFAKMVVFDSQSAVAV